MTETTAPRFIALDANLAPTEPAGPDHVITRDTLTGVEYADGGMERAGNWETANKAPGELTLAGGGWQLASYHEATAIVDTSRCDPAVDPKFFPWVKPTWYWLRDNGGKAAWSSASAWFVHFYDGHVYGYHRAGGGFALACRRAGQ